MEEGVPDEAPDNDDNVNVSSCVDSGGMTRNHHPRIIVSQRRCRSSSCSTSISIRRKSRMRVLVSLLVCLGIVLHQVKFETHSIHAAVRAYVVASSAEKGDEIHNNHFNATQQAFSSEESSSLQLFSFPVQPTIVVQLSGELGNHLSKIAPAYGVQLLLKEKYGMDAKLVMRHQDHSKWTKTPPILRQCFPKLAHWDYEEGNSEEFLERQRQQAEWLASRHQQQQQQQQAILDRVNGIPAAVPFGNRILTEEILDEPLRLFRSLLIERNATQNTSFVDDETATISLPFLYMDTFSVHFMVDRYYDEIRKLFQLNETACCPSMLPGPNESVFHFRNFQTEMPRKVDSKGFAEAGPQLTAQVLFGGGTNDTNKNDSKVSITTRFHNLNLVPYLQAFQAQQHNSKVVITSDPTLELNGVYDLCYLLKTPQRLVGSYRSTFAFWAAILGQAQPAVLYIYDYDGLQQLTQNAKDEELLQLLGYKWTNPKLQQRVQWRVVRDDMIE